MMEKEIYSQAQIIDNLVQKYIKNYCILIDVPLLVKRAVLIASGSSYNSALYGKYFFETIAKIPASVEYASEFSNIEQVNYEIDTLYIFISQSGSSTDTLTAMQKVKNFSNKTLCITNNSNSPMYNFADYKVNIEAGVEEAIAATKTFSASVFALWAIACKVAQNRHIDITSHTSGIYSISKNIEKTIEEVDNINVAAKFLSKQKDFSTFGFGVNYPLAREAALKIQETSYINISTYPMGEYIHGHYALLNKSKVFLTFITGEKDQNEIKLLEKITKTYKTKSVVITDEWEDYNCSIIVKIPKDTSKISTIISSIVVIQLLALKIALTLKRNIDKPLGLSKVVKES